MEALGVGDLHLTDAAGMGGLSKYLPNPDEFVLSEFGKVLDYGRKKGVNRVIQYGDICDGPRMGYEAMVGLSRFLSDNDDFQFELMLGNHDMYGETPAAGHSMEVLKLLYSKKNVRIHVTPRNLLIDGAKVRVLPYPHRAFDGTALNIFHDYVYGAQNDHGRPSKDEGLSKSKAVICGGHIHTNHRVRNTYYVGTLYQTNFGEALPKFFHHIEFKSPEDYEIRNVKHSPSITLHNVVLQTRDDLATIPTKPSELVKLVIQDGCDVSASDYAKFTNIAITKNFKTKEDLKIVLTEDLMEGRELVIRTNDFFKNWVAAYDVPEEMRDRIRSTRSRVLSKLNQDKRKRK